MLRQLLIYPALVSLVIFSAPAHSQEVFLRKVEVPGANFDVVFAMLNPASTRTAGHGDQNNPLTVSPTAAEFAFALSGEIEKATGGTGMPIHAIRLEIQGCKPANALNVYVVPKVVQPAKEIGHP